MEKKQMRNVFASFFWRMVIDRIDYLRVCLPGYVCKKYI